MVLWKLAVDFLSKNKKLNLNQALYTNTNSLWIKELNIKKFKTRETLKNV